MAREREHEFECREDGVVVTVLAALGDTPETPTCPTCDKPMVRVWGLPNVSFSRKWRISMGR